LATPAPALTLPLLHEQTLLMIAMGGLAAAVVALVLITLLVSRNPQLLQELLGLDTLHMLTVALVVVTTGTLALEGILSGEAVASILGGVVGYVLGSLKSMGQPPERRPPET